MGFVEDIYGPQVEEKESASVYDYQNIPENRSWAGALPLKQGLYDPELEKDACGVGFAALVATFFQLVHTFANVSHYSHIKGKASHKIVSDGRSTFMHRP